MINPDCVNVQPYGGGVTPSFQLLETLYHTPCPKPFKQFDKVKKDKKSSKNFLVLFS
jgi:hypothetical protein